MSKRREHLPPGKKAACHFTLRGQAEPNQAPRGAGNRRPPRVTFRPCERMILKIALLPLIAIAAGTPMRAEKSSGVGAILAESSRQTRSGQILVLRPLQDPMPVNQWLHAKASYGPGGPKSFSPRYDRLDAPRVLAQPVNGSILTRWIDGQLCARQNPYGNVFPTISAAARRQRWRRQSMSEGALIPFRLQPRHCPGPDPALCASAGRTF